MNYKEALQWAVLFGLCGAAYILSTPPEQKKQEPKKTNIVEITTENAKDYNNIAIHFYSPSCQHCNYVDKTIETVAETYQDTLTFGRTDFHKNQEIVQHFNINTHPTIIFLKDAKETERITGIISAQELEAVILMHYLTQ
ncbi:thioredoxin family protein [Candidatus Woesearchaeota archaeon]|nr:thioredoxin family protein [Candidatus Woesearchaeota archaeon]